MKRFFVLLLLVFLGCDDSAALLETPDLDVAEAAAAAIAQYDTDQDGTISSAEAKRTALDPRAGWDTDRDNKISEEEIRARLELYEARKPGMIEQSCTVFLNNIPLDGAEVVFEPEEFLGGSIETARGTTDANGSANMIIPEIVEQDPTLTGLRTGLYKVKITHPNVEIPARYNEETTLTIELSPVENIVPPVFKLRK